MEIIEKIIEKTRISKYLFEQFNQYFKVNGIIEYCLKELPRSGEFKSVNNELVEFIIHGSDIDFSYKERKVICDRIKFEYFKAHTLCVFINDRTDFNLLYHIQESLYDLERENRITKVENRNLTYRLVTVARS